MSEPAPLPPITENERWLLSFYRVSEISGALFFGRLAKSLRPSAIQQDLTKHFADESQHAWYWTDCLMKLGKEATPLPVSYQDQYLAAGGMPANLMETLAVTQVFEKRVIGQYALHMSVPDLNPVIRSTIKTIVQDERWHVRWVNEALERMAPEYGQDRIETALKRYQDADAHVYAATLKEHEQRVRDILGDRAPVALWEEE